MSRHSDSMVQKLSLLRLESAAVALFCPISILRTSWIQMDHTPHAELGILSIQGIAEEMSPHSIKLFVTSSTFPQQHLR